MLVFTGILILAADSGKVTNVLENETENNNNPEAEEMDEDAGSADKDVFTVATDNSYAQFEFIDDETGELEGFDVVLIEALAEEADIEIEIQQLEFDGIVAGVGSGKFDIGIAGM